MKVLFKNHYDGENFTLKCEASDTIDEICHKSAFLPSSFSYYFIFRGKKLDFCKGCSKTISDYGIDKVAKEDRIIHLVKIIKFDRHVVVVTKFKTFERIPLGYDETDTVENIKTKISEIIGYPSGQSTLTFAGQRLEDDRTLIDYNISGIKISCISGCECVLGRSTIEEQNKSTLYHVIKERIFVQIEDKTITLRIDAAFDTIKSVQDKIRMQSGIPSNSQRLCHYGKHLEHGHFTLSDYNVSGEHTIVVEKVTDIDSQSSWTGKKSNVHDNIEDDFSSQITMESIRSLESPSNQIHMDYFKQRIPSWGGNLVVDGILTNTKLDNTCTIDYFLLSMWCATKLNAEISNNPFLSKYIKILIQHIENFEWNKAKSFFLLKIAERQATNGNIDCSNSEYAMFIKYFHDSQIYKIKEKCPQCPARNATMKSLMFKKAKSNVVLNIADSCCIRCDKDGLSIYHSFKFSPSWLFIDTKEEDNITVFDLPKSLYFKKFKKYALLSATFKTLGHFRAIFNLNNTFYLVDGIKPTELTTNIPTHKVSWCFYYMI